MIVRDRIPCWYELSFRAAVGIVLRIHQDFATNATPIQPSAPIVQQFKRDFGFKKFGGVFGHDLGYEHSLKFLGQVGQFLEYHIPASLCRKVTTKLCRRCKGLAEDENTATGKCLWCDGEGREVVIDYAEAYAVSASLTTLLLLMSFPEIETSSPNPQLMTVQTMTVREQHGGSLHGEYSTVLVEFLRTMGQSQIPEMVIAMQEVHKMMEGRMADYHRHSFSAYTLGNEGCLNVSCPGDACGLNPGHMSIQEGNGYKFSCHNVDQMIQQMTLLGALAALHDLARHRPTVK
ncbi:MAG TPA: hypothetical protein VJC13_01960 [Candidatus Paceibacterota bacterium]